MVDEVKAPKCLDEQVPTTETVNVKEVVSAVKKKTASKEVSETKEEQIMRVAYMRHFAAYLIVLDAQYNQLVQLRNELPRNDRGSKNERRSIDRRMRYMQVQISKAGSLWSAMARGMLKPWLADLAPSVAVLETTPSM